MTQHAGGDATRNSGDHPALAAPDAADRLTRLAHELNSLLDGSLRWINLAARTLPATDGETDQTRRQLDTVRSALERMAELVAAAAGPMAMPELIAARVTLGDAVDHAADVVRPRAAELGIVIATAVDDAARARPAGPVYTILLNGVRNAVESIERSLAGLPGAGQIDVRVAVMGTASRRTLVIEVEDDGQGPPVGGDPRAVFAPDFSTRGPGRGIGLALTRDLVRAAGGRVDLLPGRGNAARPGAVLRVEIPIDHEARP